MSTQMITEPECRRLVESVTAIGGTVPQPITDVLDTIDAAKNWTGPKATDLRTAARKGELTAANVAKKLTDTFNHPEVNPYDHKMKAVAGLIHHFVDVVQENSDDLILSLRPHFNAAADGIRAAAEHITPDTTPTQVLEKGPEAAAAWRALDDHRRTLDDIRAVIRSLAGNFETLGVPEQRVFQTGTSAYTAAYFLAPERSEPSWVWWRP